MFPYKSHGEIVFKWWEIIFPLYYFSPSTLKDNWILKFNFYWREKFFAGYTIYVYTQMHVFVMIVIANMYVSGWGLLKGFWLMTLRFSDTILYFGKLESICFNHIVLYTWEIFETKYGLCNYFICTNISKFFTNIIRTFDI